MRVPERSSPKTRFLGLKPMTDQLTLRPISDDDLPFLERLYGSTRADEMAAVDWTDAEKEAFLAMQFRAQHRHYQAYYANADFDVIELDGEPIGRLYLDRRDDEIRIVDIALLPAYRGRGIGTRYLKQIMAEAAALARPVRIHVEHFNPAMRLYRRLGFRHVDSNGVYHLMEWQPETA